MTNDDNIGDEKLHTILTEYAKISINMNILWAK